MTASVRNSLLLLAIICPFYVAIIGSCCSGKCSDPNPCTSECYAEPSGGCPSPANNPYSVADGTECPSGAGVYGQCTAGVCGPNECAGIQNLFACSHPRTGGTEGICIDQRCVASGAADSCVKFNYGRMNCCTADGCSGANGTRCGDSDRTVLNGQACDPSGVLPVGQGSGSCQNGICTTGSYCTGIDNGDGTYGPCDSGEICKKDTCLAASSSCDSSPSNGSLPCMGGAGAGTCEGGTCDAGAPCSHDCDDGNPCTRDACNPAKLIDGMCPDQICCEHTPMDTSTPTPCVLSPAGGQGLCDSTGTCIPGGACVNAPVDPAPPQD